MLIYMIFASKSVNFQNFCQGPLHKELLEVSAHALSEYKVMLLQ